MSELVAAGISRHAVDRAVGNGHLVRLRKNVVADAAAWRALAPSGRHATRARAIYLGLPQDAREHLALSHHSSLALQGLPLFGVDDRVHLARTDGGRGRSNGIVQVHAPVPAAFVKRGGLPLVEAGLACLQVADAFGTESGLVCADAALRAGTTTTQRLAEALRQGRFGRGRPGAVRVARFADGASESPGESRTRWVMFLAGLPAPALQEWIADERGIAVARVDFLFREHGTIVEFDGMVKYGQADGREALAREKQREDRLRDLGYEVVRLIWEELADPELVRRKILAAFARHAARGR